MGNPPGEGGASQQHGRGNESHHKSSRRRNTVHSSSAGQSASPNSPSPAAATAATPTAYAAPWPPLAINYPPPHPIFIPFYPHIWPLPQPHHLNQAGLVHAALPVTPSVMAGSQGRAHPPSSRSGSPQRRGRARVRSPERSTDTEDDGGPTHSDQRRQEAVPAKSTSGKAAMKGNDLEAFPPWPARPVVHEHHHGQHPPATAATAAAAAATTTPAHASPLVHLPSSVPSTPRQRPRKLSNGAASPPTREEVNHSPRSVRSESDGRLPALRVAPVGCRFEQPQEYPRRRMPYSLGSDPLERNTSNVKKTLEPDEEKKLSGDMRELYDRLLPSPDSEARRARFVDKLHRLLNEQWPGQDIQVRVFGSSGNLLCTSESDVDICIVTPMKELERVCLLARVLHDHGMQNVICVSSAKVPIVRMWDPELKLACDMNVNNTLALENTRMIKTYVEIDPRVRPLAMVVKHWTKRRLINEAAFGGTLSSYTWICLILNFLQTRQPPILPSLHQRPHQKLPAVNGVESPFADDLDSLRGYGERNRQTLGELLFQFFRYYGYEIDYERDVVSVRQGRLISKQEKGWHLMQNNRMCVEEPFNVHRNLGNTADDASFRGLHLELRRAFSFIADQVDLEGCCEQYVFPVEEERVFERPAPQPRPVLSRSSSQSGRGPRNGVGSGRGGRHNASAAHQGQRGERGGHGGRRASSSAAFGNVMPNFLPYPPLAMAAHEAYRTAPLDIQDQFQQSYRALQVQKQELTMLQAQAQAQAQSQAASQGHSRRDGSSRRNNRSTPAHLNTLVPGTAGNVEHAPHTAPLRPQMYFYPLQYATTQPYLAPGITTSPSSPSIVPVQSESLRGGHRPLVVDGSESSGARSHSQPARPLRSPLRTQAVPAGSPTLNEMVRVPPNDRNRENVGQEENHPGSRQHASSASHTRPVMQSTRPDHTPKEYVGWYVDGSPSSLQQLEDVVLRPVPTFGDLSPPAIHTAPLHQTVFEGVDVRQGAAASPISWDMTDNPSNALRIEGTVSGTPASIDDSRSELNRTPEHRGPLIVDGSSSTPRVDRHGSSMARSGDVLIPDEPHSRTTKISSGRSQPEGSSVGMASTRDREAAHAFLPEGEYRRPTVVSSTSMAQDFEAAGQAASSSPPLGGGSKSGQLSGGASPPRSPYLANGVVGGGGGGGGSNHSSKARSHVASSTSSSQDAPPLLQTAPTTPESKRVPQTTSTTVPALLSPVLENHSPSSLTGRSDEYFSSANQARMNGVRGGGGGGGGGGGRNDVVRTREPQPPPIPLGFSTTTSSSSLIANASDRRAVLATKPNGYVRDREDMGGNSPGGTAAVANMGMSMGNSNAINGWQQTMTKQQRKAAAAAAAAATANTSAGMGTGKGAAVEGAKKGGSSLSSTLPSTAWAPVPSPALVSVSTSGSAGAKAKNTAVDVIGTTTNTGTMGSAGTSGTSSSSSSGGGAGGKVMPVNEAERKGG